MRTMVAITCGLVIALTINTAVLTKQFKEIKHLVNDVICEALKMEETYHE